MWGTVIALHPLGSATYPVALRSNLGEAEGRIGWHRRSNVEFGGKSGVVKITGIP